MPPVMYSQPCGPIPSTTASAPAVADGEAHPGPARRGGAARPVAPYSTVLPAIASVDGGRAEVGLGDDRDRPARQPLGDVVVGLADQPQLDARPGERPERLAGGPAQLEPDRAVQLAALERAGQARPERAVGRRQPQTRRP